MTEQSDPARGSDADARSSHPDEEPADSAGGRHEQSAGSIAVAKLVDREPSSPDGAAPHAASGDARSDDVPHDGAAPPPRGEQAGPAAHKWWTLVGVCLGTFMLLLDVTIVNVALPDIQHALHSSFSDLQWVIDAYALTLAALLLTAGSLADTYGRRRLYIVGLGIFTIASLLCGSAQNTLMLQISRGAQGVGGAVMFSVSLALLADAFRGKDRGVAFGIWGGITGLASALGPLLGGILTSGLSWRWIFFVNLPVGVAATVIVIARVSESRAPRARRPDWLGFGTFTIALAALVYGLIESSERSFGDSRVVASLITAGVLLVVFVIVEATTPEPMFDLTLFSKPTFTGGAVAAFGMSASAFALLVYFVLYIQNVLGFDAFGTGLRMLSMSGGILMFAAVAGRLTSKISIRFLIGPGLVVIGVGLLLMRGLDAGTVWTHLLPGLIISGAGIGLVNAPLASTAVGVVEPQRAGMASGINSTFRQVGVATGIALLGTLFSNRVTSEVLSRVAGNPDLAGRGHELAIAVRSGAVGQLVAKAPQAARGTIEQVAKGSFASGLNLILLVGAIIAFAAAAVALVTIRRKDLVAPDAAH